MPLAAGLLANNLFIYSLSFATEDNTVRADDNGSFRMNKGAQAHVATLRELESEE